MAMTAAVNAVDLSGRMRKSCPHSIAECGQQSPKQVPNAHGPLGFSPQPNNIAITELLAVSGYLPCVLLPLLLHCRKQAQRDVLIITVIHLSGALLGSFFRSMTLNQEMFCAWSVRASMIKHMEKTEANVTPRLKTNCKLQAGMQKETSHIPPLCLLTSSASFSV